MLDADAAASDERSRVLPSSCILFDETRWENYFSSVCSFSAKLEGGEKRRKAGRPLQYHRRKEGRSCDNASGLARPTFSSDVREISIFF